MDRELREVQLSALKVLSVKYLIAKAQKSIQDMAAILTAGGFLPPIVVYPHKDKFVVLDGRKRVEAHKKAGKLSLWAVTLDAPDFFTPHHFQVFETKKSRRALLKKMIAAGILTAAECYERFGERIGKGVRPDRSPIENPKSRLERDFNEQLNRQKKLTAEFNSLQERCLLYADALEEIMGRFGKLIPGPLSAEVHQAVQMCRA